MARGQIEGLGTSPRFKAKDATGQVLADVALERRRRRSFGHPEAFAHLAQWACEQYAGELAPVAVGHRMAHGGLEFTEPTLIDAEVLAKLEQLIPLVPLHQPHNLAAVKAVMQLRPDLPQVACFDTAFHRGRAEGDRAIRLARRNVPARRCAAGASTGCLTNTSPASFGGSLRTLRGGRVIVAHLGSGASLCAMRDGRSVDTTMSFSALDGLPMGTRCGTLDPGVVLFLLRQGWSRRSDRGASLQEIRPAGNLRRQQRRARTAGQRQPAGGRGDRVLRVSHRSRDRLA